MPTNNKYLVVSNLSLYTRTSWIIFPLHTPLCRLQCHQDH